MLPQPSLAAISRLPSSEQFNRPNNAFGVQPTVLGQPAPGLNLFNLFGGQRQAQQQQQRPQNFQQQPQRPQNFQPQRPQAPQNFQPQRPQAPQNFQPSGPALFQPFG